MKKYLSVFLALVLLCIALASCNANEISEDASEESEAQVSEQEKELFGNLPDINYSIGDTSAEFIILTIGDWSGNYKSVEVCAHENSPEIIQDAVKERNRLVEERFGVKITEKRTTDTAGMVNNIRDNSATGGDAYDAVMPYMTDAATLAAEGLFYDLLDQDTVKLDGEWWDQNSINTLSIDEKLFFATGDMCLLAYDCTHCMVFNRDLATSHNVDPYALVRSGEWTLEKLLEIAKEVTAFNDDGVHDFDDTWGCMINSNFTTSMFLGSGERLTDKDGNDLPVIAVQGDRQTEVFGKIFNLCDDTHVCHLDSNANMSKYGNNIWTAASSAVANKRTLFRAVAVVDIFEIASMDCNYGVLPIPKADTDQDKYYSNVSAVCATCIAIPRTNDDFDMALIISDALMQASTDTVKDAYYNNVLKLRKLQDDNDEEMLDIIFGNRVYDYGILFQWGGINTFMNDIAFSGTNSFQSKFDSIEGSIKGDIDRTLEGMR